jgi:hypothetical protein
MARTRSSINVSLITAMLSIIAETPVSAQVNNYFAGTASNGQQVNLDLGSIRQVSPSSLDFTYYLGGSRIYAQANCQGGFWVSFPEKQINRPQSSATQRMLSKICTYLSGFGSPARSTAGAALVFDPPSNIRSSPNGAVLCSVRSPTYINIDGRSGQWYTTDFCGSPGYIHQGQLRF